MKRFALEKLDEWKASRFRKPLVLDGARQVGKTTMLKQALAAADVPFAYHSADAVAGRGLEWIGTVWESARTQLRAGGHASFTLVIDEIQKIRGWSEAVK